MRKELTTTTEAVKPGNNVVELEQVGATIVTANTSKGAKVITISEELEATRTKETMKIGVVLMEAKAATSVDKVDTRVATIEEAGIVITIVVKEATVIDTNAKTIANKPSNRLRR